ncbi:MAG TPA: hypothetical protein VMB02_16205, partial [Candidatus Aquilonibacter sp.]|nr:hypothetical protein [Candidatus Aquilonibacter sp.]
MQGSNAPYGAVYHFLDDGLFARFIEDIPRSQIVGYLRNNETVRNRYFRGFRVSNAVPTNQQILSAFKREIVERRNGDLASLLCAGWIRQHAALAHAALSNLGIQSDNSSDAYQWIGEVHSKLESGSRQDILRELLRFLAPKFSRDDILIFVSTVSCGDDQTALRAFVDQELKKTLNEP